MKKIDRKHTWIFPKRKMVVKRAASPPKIYKELRKEELLNYNDGVSDI